MYRFSLPTEGDSKHPDWSEPSPVAPSRPEPPQPKGEGKRSTAPPPLPLPAAPPRGSPRKQRRTHEDYLITSEAGSLVSGQHFADALDLGPEYSFYHPRTGTASAPIQEGPPPPRPGKLTRVRTMPSLISEPSMGMPSGLPAISGQDLNVSDEETAALIAAAAQANEFSNKRFKQDVLGDPLALPPNASSHPHPLSIAASQHQDALENALPLDHLPKLEQGSTDPTAYPNWHVLAEREVELARLNSGDRLDVVLGDPQASESLRAFAATLPDPRASLLLSLYTDLLAFSSQAATLRLASSAISSSYFLANSPLRLSLNISQRGPTLAVLYRTAAVGHGLNEPLQAIKREVDEQILELWVQETAIKKLNERLGMWQVGVGWTGRTVVAGAGTPDERTDGLTESFCLTDPSLHDNTIVAASEGFAMVTGYPVPEIVGRNCRFLQGPGTSPASVKPLREALLRGERVTWTVFNYRRDGTPYYNLICLNPLRDSHGKVRFVLGGQTDATDTMQQILPVGRAGTRQTPPNFSATVQDQLDRLQPPINYSGGNGSALVAHGAASMSTAALVTPQPEYPYLPPAAAPTPSDLLPVPGPGFGARPSLLQRGRGLSKVWKRNHNHHKDGDDDGSIGNSTNGKRQNSSEADKASIAPSFATDPGLAADFTPSNTYVRVALVSAGDYKVLFATPELARLLGLSGAAYASLAGIELVNLLKAPLPVSASSPKDEEVKEQTRRLRRNVGTAMEQGHPYKGFVRIKAQTKKNKLLPKPSKATKTEDFKHAVLHLTPLKSAEGQVTHLVAIFG